MSRIKVVLANDTRRREGEEQHWGSWLTTTNLEKLLTRAGYAVIDRLRLGRLRNSDAIWERVEKAQLLVINGEGSVHSERDIASNILGSFPLAKQRRLSAWIVNHHCWGCDSLLRQYDFADFVAVRDIASMGYLVQNGIAPRLAADCCFLSPPAKETQRNRLLVCSGLRPPSQEVITQWANGLNCAEVVLCNDFYPTFDSTKAVKSSSAEDSFQLFASSKFVVSSSFHGCIFAANHHVPFLPTRVSGQPPKTMIAAVEAMGKHAQRICQLGPSYVIQNYAEIVSTMQARVAGLRKRARFNIPKTNRQRFV